MKRVVGALALLALCITAAVYLHSYRETMKLDLSGLTSYGSSFVPPPSVTVSRRPAGTIRRPCWLWCSEPAAPWRSCAAQK